MSVCLSVCFCARYLKNCFSWDQQIWHRHRNVLPRVPETCLFWGQKVKGQGRKTKVLLAWVRDFCSYPVFSGSGIVLSRMWKMCKFWKDSQIWNVRSEKVKVWCRLTLQLSQFYLEFFLILHLLFFAALGWVTESNLPRTFSIFTAQHNDIAMYQNG